MPHLTFSATGCDARRRSPHSRGMDTEREYDQDTVGDFDETTLDGSEGLDADAITTDGEDLPAEAPEEWKPAEEDETLEERLEAERPDIGEGGTERGPEDGAAPGDDAERTDPIDDLDPGGETRVLGED